MPEYLKYQQFNNKVWEEIATRTQYSCSRSADVFSLPNVDDVYIRFVGMPPFPIYSINRGQIVGYLSRDTYSVPGKVINRFEAIYTFKD